MNDAILTEGDYRVVSTEPFDLESPRWGAEMGTMLCVHPRYNLGDEQGTGVIDDLYRVFSDEGPEAAIQWLRDEHGTTVVLPLYLHDHSGLSMSAGPNLLSEDGLMNVHGGGWDTSLVGCIFDTAANRVDWVGDIEEILRGEIAEYDSYLRGEVYVLRVEMRCVDTLHNVRRLPDGTEQVTDATREVWVPVPDATVITMYGPEGHEAAARDLLNEQAIITAETPV